MGWMRTLPASWLASKGHRHPIKDVVLTRERCFQCFLLFITPESIPSGLSGATGNNCSRGLWLHRAGHPPQRHRPLSLRCSCAPTVSRWCRCRHQPSAPSWHSCGGRCGKSHACRCQPDEPISLKRVITRLSFSSAPFATAILS